MSEQKPGLPMQSRVGKLMASEWQTQARAINRLSEIVETQRKILENQDLILRGIVDILKESGLLDQALKSAKSKEVE